MASALAVSTFDAAPRLLITASASASNVFASSAMCRLRVCCGLEVGLTFVLQPLPGGSAFLEVLDRACHLPELAGARPGGCIDGEIVAGELVHAFADRAERLDDLAPHRPEADTHGDERGDEGELRQPPCQARAVAQARASSLGDRGHIGCDRIEHRHRNPKVGLERAVDQLERGRLRETPDRLQDRGGRLGDFSPGLAQRPDRIGRNDPLVGGEGADLCFDLVSDLGNLRGITVDPRQLKLGREPCDQSMLPLHQHADIRDLQGRRQRLVDVGFQLCPPR